MELLHGEGERAIRCIARLSRPDAKASRREDLRGPWIEEGPATEREREKENPAEVGLEGRREVNATKKKDMRTKTDGTDARKAVR